jgi:hypothetical protein
MEHKFPFGQLLKQVKQEDTSPKKVFVLGVYASAVHAKWVDKNDKTLVQALAVASEPYIFWDGDIKYTQKVIDDIAMPDALGKLIPANLNGPSAKALDDNILNPLGYMRADAWLCDLIPEARLNDSQQAAIHRAYAPWVGQHGLQAATVPKRLGSIRIDDARRNDITGEIQASQARTLILLGDDPIKQYLNKVADVDFRSLKEYIILYGYGKPYSVKIGTMEVDVIPFAHPRQIAKLGRSSDFWYTVHQKWEASRT